MHLLDKAKRELKQHVSRQICGYCALGFFVVSYLRMTLTLFFWKNIYLNTDVLDVISSILDLVILVNSFSVSSDVVTLKISLT
jgi:hypothetical protein